VTYRKNALFPFTNWEDFSNSGEAAYEAQMIFRINTKFIWDPANSETK